MAKEAAPLIGMTICDMFGLDANKITDLQLRINRHGLASVTVEYIFAPGDIEHPGGDEVARIQRTYELKLREEAVIHG